MENETWSELAEKKSSRPSAAFCSGENDATGLACMHAAHGGSSSAKEEVKRTVRSLVERFGLSREDLVSAYDICMLERDGQEVHVERNDAAYPPVFAQPAGSSATAETTSSSRVQVNGEYETVAAAGEGVMEVQEGKKERGRDDEVNEDGMKGENEKGERLESLSDSSTLEEKEEVDKMQCLVQSALRVYEASSVVPELGQKRRCFTLEDELNLQPSSFAQELLEYVNTHTYTPAISVVQLPL